MDEMKGERRHEKKVIADWFLGCRYGPQQLQQHPQQQHQPHPQQQQQQQQQQQGGPSKPASGLSSLQERLRSLANNEAPPPLTPQRPSIFGTSSTSSSSLTGGPSWLEKETDSRWSRNQCRNWLLWSTLMDGPTIFVLA